MKTINEAMKKLQELKRITESNEEEKNPYENIKVYMNTWGNYNEYGADVEQINGGWMSIEQAKEFLERHKDEEPFINDTDNVPGDLDIDEYTNPWQAIEMLDYIENCDNKDALIAIIESTGNDFEEDKRIYEDGDYTFFAGVDNDADLGKAYVDMVGFSGINKIENYVNREYVKQGLVDSLDSEEDLSDDTIEAMVDEEIEMARVGNDEAFFEDYFDYESLGRDLDNEGYFFASTGAIETM